MSKRLLIVEDNKRDYERITGFLKAYFPDVQYYPETIEQNNELRRNIKQYFSPNAPKRDAAKAYIHALGFNGFDGILLDYVLDSDFQGVNGVALYKSLNLNIKAIVLTKLTAADFDKIKTAISHEGLDKEIIPEQKGTGTKLSDDQVALYKKRINSHIFGVRENGELPTVVILTALMVEYNAVAAHLSDRTKMNIEGVKYEEGIFSHEGKKIARVIVRECSAKMGVAAQEAERAVSNFNPNCMFYVGIAGSRKPNDFKLGDVIFAEKIYSYEGMKAEKDVDKVRPETETVSAALLEIAKDERRGTKWKDLLPEGFPEGIKADVGIIASGNQLIEDVESHVGKILEFHYNDTSAVEMEGYAFAAAAKRQPGKNVEIGVVRGISDIIKRPGTTADGEDNRPEHAKSVASNAAAAFTFRLIYSFYEN